MHRVTVLLALAAVSIAGCSAQKAAPSQGSSAAAANTVTVNATDSACAPSPAQTGTGATTFVVTNNGTKVTEFYVYGTDDRVLGEVENISPGLRRELVIDFAEPGSYRLACKPGMVGDGVRAEFTVTG